MKPYSYLVLHPNAFILFSLAHYVEQKCSEIEVIGVQTIAEAEKILSAEAQGHRDPNQTKLIGFAFFTSHPDIGFHWVESMYEMLNPDAESYRFQFTPIAKTGDTGLANFLYHHGIATPFKRLEPHQCSYIGNWIVERTFANKRVALAAQHWLAPSEKEYSDDRTFVAA